MDSMEYILELPAWTVNLPRGVHSAFIADILHVEGVMYVVLEHLSAGDLLRFAAASLACRSAVRPRSLENKIFSRQDVQVIEGLQGWGCLEPLQQVTVQVIPAIHVSTKHTVKQHSDMDEGSLLSGVMSATLNVLRTCSSLKRMIVIS